MEERGVQERGVEERGVEERGVQERGVEERGVEERGVWRSGACRRVATRGPFRRLPKSLCDFGDRTLTGPLTAHTLVGVELRPVWPPSGSTLDPHGKGQRSGSVRADRRNDPREA